LILAKTKQSLIRKTSAMSEISWWRTHFGEEEVNKVADSIRQEHLSQGPVTVEFERQVADLLDIPYVVATTSGSMALLMSLWVLGVGPGDEVIVPNRTWIATAHAPLLLGAKVKLVDVEPDRPIIDASLIEGRITEKTKAIIPVHMNGRAADMQRIKAISSKHNIYVIEDAAQAIGSKNHDGFLGTQADIGCFSLSVAKTISTGQGGFLVTDNEDIAQCLMAIRTHGVESVKDPQNWIMPGFNCRFTDIQASIGLVQLQKFSERIERLKQIYCQYREGLSFLPQLKLIPVDLDAGEVPVYIEVLCDERESLIRHLDAQGIEARPFYPDLDYAPYLDQGRIEFPNSRKYGKNGIYLPSGPAQKTEDIEATIMSIGGFYQT
jgi:perosamine synthetase